MKSAPRQYRAPSGTPTLKPRRSSAVAGVSEIFGVAVNSPLPNSAASTLRSSPLRHEIYRDDSTSSTNIEDGMSVSSRKRGRDDEIASVTSIQFGIEEPLSPTFSAADSNKKSRLKDLDTTEALTSELIPEPIPIPSVPVSEDASAPSSAPIRWFGSLSRKISRPNVSLSVPPTVSDYTIPPEPAVIATRNSHVGPPREVSTEATPDASIASVPSAGVYENTRSELSIRSGITSWFSGNGSARSVSVATQASTNEAQPPTSILSEAKETSPSAPGAETDTSAPFPENPSSVTESGEPPQQTDEGVYVPNAQGNLDDPNNSTVPTSLSWWSYLGLGSDKPLPHSPAPLPVESKTDSSVPEMSLAVDREANDAADKASAALGFNTQTPTHPDVDEVPPPSIASADTASRVSWFGYMWGKGRAAPDNPATGEQDPAAAGAVTHTLTESERIKEEALAREVSKNTIETAASGSVVDPVLNVETKSAWISFFARGRMPVKTIKNEDGATEPMEVMDIDEPEAPPSTVVPVTSPVVQSGLTNLPVSKSKELPPPSTSSRVPSSPNSPSAPARKGPSDPRRGPSGPRAPNLVLPTWGDTFYAPPRGFPPSADSTLRRTLNVVSRLLTHAPSIDPELEEYRRERVKRYFSGSAFRHDTSTSQASDYEGSRLGRSVGKDLPRAWNVLEDPNGLANRIDVRRIVVIGIHGWFPGVIMRRVLGEPTGTSKKFADMMETAIQEFANKRGMKNLEKITKIPLEGEGSIETRVSKLFRHWQENPEWIDDLHNADAIFIATHSQGCIASTQLLDRLIADGHINTGKNWEAVVRAGDLYGFMPRKDPQRLCLLGLCGVHHGPLYWLNNSTVVNPYITYFESPAARELFEFQDSESAASINYTVALRRVLDHGAKMVYVASLNDQVVPIYSASFTAASHPSILRGLYVDGDAYSSSDFLSNLIVMLLRIRNAGLDDGGLLVQLSEATAGSLSGVGHSTAYEELATYSLAVRFLFETNDIQVPTSLKLEPFQARAPRNDYAIPWSLRGLIEDRRIALLFAPELEELRGAFDQWQPKTSILRDVRRKLEPIRQGPRKGPAVGSSPDPDPSSLSSGDSSRAVGSKL